MRCFSVINTIVILCMGIAFNALASTSYNYRALIVGVSEYPSLKDKSLIGPKNDATRMRDLLIGRGVPTQNITVLADGVSGAASLPTRQQIISSLNHLAKTAKPNDYIIIHMSGHGSQQPVPQGSPYAEDEPDGLFEIFLPRDVSNWSDQKNGDGGAINNAVLDHEIRASVDRMTAAGAFVWAIFDTCHSATMVRSAGNSEVKLRQITPSELGIPDQEINRAVGQAKNAKASQSNSLSTKRPTSTPGKAVYFYAVQTNEPAPEMPLPAGVPGSINHGVFTFSILQTLEGGANMTYQQLGQQVLARMPANGSSQVTPVFSGTALNTGVLGQAASSVRQWLLKLGTPITIPAGQLADIHPDAIFAVLPSAVAKTDEAIGYVKVHKSTTTSAELVSVSYGGKPEQSLMDLKDGKFARLVRPAMQFGLVASIDLSQCAKPCPFQEPLHQLLAKTEKTGGINGVQIQWKKDGQSSQLLLKADGRRLWLLPPSKAGLSFVSLAEKGSNSRANFEKSVSFLEAAGTATDANIQEQLEKMLGHTAKANNLMRVAASLSSAPAASALQVQLFHVDAQGKQKPLRFDRIPIFRSGDKMRVEMTNSGRKALDVTALYLDSKYGVGVMFPEIGASNRIDAKTEKSGAISFEIEINDETLGMERLALIVVEAEKLGERADYSYLAQDSLANAVVTRGNVRSTGGSGQEFFDDLGFATHLTRGAKTSPAPSSTGMQVYTWQVSP